MGEWRVGFKSPRKRRVKVREQGERTGRENRAREQGDGVVEVT